MVLHYPETDSSDEEDPLPEWTQDVDRWEEEDDIVRTITVCFGLNRSAIHGVNARLPDTKFEVFEKVDDTRYRLVITKIAGKLKVGLYTEYEPSGSDFVELAHQPI